MKGRTFKLSRWALIAMFMALLAGFALAFWAKSQTERPEEVATSVAAPKPSPPREVEGTTIDSAGNLIITYSDGSVTNVGKVVGNTGQAGEGLYPTEAQLDDALARYCADGRCDPNNPTQAQVLDAVAAYCQGGTCQGPRGQQGPAPTAEQLAVAVTSYCSDGRCQGVAGEQGPAAPKADFSCVERITNNARTRYVAWKYVDKPDSTYEDLYQLPVWAECPDPIDLTGEPS